jgi:hypothetical protein
MPRLPAPLHRLVFGLAGTAVITLVNTPHATDPAPVPTVATQPASQSSATDLPAETGLARGPVMVQVGSPGTGARRRSLPPVLFVAQATAATAMRARISFATRQSRRAGRLSRLPSRRRRHRHDRRIPRTGSPTAPSQATGPHQRVQPAPCPRPRRGGPVPAGYVLKRGVNARYRLDPTTVQVDLWQVRDLLTRARLASPPIRTDLLRDACDLYTAPLAEGCDYEWVEPHREKARQWGTDAHLLLADDSTRPSA